MADDKPAEEVKVDAKAADPVAVAAKAAADAKPAADNKPAPVAEVKSELKADAKPSEELKTLLDEAGAEEVKLDKDGKPVEVKAKVVPEKYEAFKLPEGVVVDPKALELASPLFKELGLDQEGAQKLIDLQIQMNKNSEDQHIAAFDQYVEGLKKESRDYFGVKLPEVMRNVARARDQFVHKELQDKLNISGLANDKDVLLLLDKIGRVVGEGKFVEGKQSAPAKGDGSTEAVGVALKDVYPSMSKK